MYHPFGATFDRIYRLCHHGEWHRDDRAVTCRIVLAIVGSGILALFS